jgi:hypothetical protein
MPLLLQTDGRINEVTMFLGFEPAGEARACASSMVVVGVVGHDPEPEVQPPAQTDVGPLALS